MRAVRVGVFETNSSSTHSITMCSKEEFDKWKDGELLFDTLDDVFVTEDEAVARIKETYKDITDEGIEDMLGKGDWCTYDNYFNDYWLETFTATHVTKKGEVIVAFGKYGHDD